jgi:aspartate aminotransferase-like enzyme
MEETVQILQKVLGTEGKVFLWEGEVSTVLEAAITNFFVPGERGIFTVMGEDGDCFARLGEVLGMEVFRLGSEWGEVVTAGDIELLLKSKPEEEIQSLFVTLHETSTGVLLDIESIARKCREWGMFLVVSAFHSAGVLELAMDRWGVDLLVSAMPEKICLLSAGKRAWERRRQKHIQSSLATFQELKQQSSPLLETLKKILERERAFDYQKIKRAVRVGMCAMGLELLVKREEIASPVFTTVVLPEGADAGWTVEELQREGITGVSNLKRKESRIIRIDHRHFSTKEAIFTLLENLGKTLVSQGVVLKIEEGINRVWEVYEHA